MRYAVNGVTQRSAGKCGVIRVIVSWSRRYGRRWDCGDGEIRIRAYMRASGPSSRLVVLSVEDHQQAVWRIGEGVSGCSR